MTPVLFNCGTDVSHAPVWLYTQSRALSALGEAPLTLMALKSLIGEGDKCRVFFEEIRVRSSCRVSIMIIAMSTWGGGEGQKDVLPSLASPVSLRHCTHVFRAH